jgi:hypothetical protein
MPNSRAFGRLNAGRARSWCICVTIGNDVSVPDWPLGF